MHDALLIRISPHRLEYVYLALSRLGYMYSPRRCMRAQPSLFLNTGRRIALPTACVAENRIGDGQINISP